MLHMVNKYLLRLNLTELIPEAKENLQKILSSSETIDELTIRFFFFLSLSGKNIYISKSFGTVEKNGGQEGGEGASKHKLFVNILHVNNM